MGNNLLGFYDFLTPTLSQQLSILSFYLNFSNCDISDRNKKVLGGE